VKLYRTSNGDFVQEHEAYYRIGDLSWDALVTHDDLHGYLRDVIARGEPAQEFDQSAVQAPIGQQEVWAAGVTYYRSRSARMEEAKDAGGGDFYDRVYSAARPELFFKATPHRVASANSTVNIRKDASWSVPEPELTLLVNPRGNIIGYTIGNDMSSRDIEGENPLYLPQAKVYDRSCALGPCILVSQEPLSKSTEIRMEILRGGRVEFCGTVTLSEMKRDPATLVEYLYRESSFPQGCFLMTGTGIVPPDSFTLRSGDQVRITIELVGTLVNEVAQA
jgi:2-dehydro-3-deoxy-D-arabinonate dehydratase